MKNLFCLCILFSLFFVQELQASYITMETTITACVSNNQATVRVESINCGDEKARNVRFDVLFPGAAQSSSSFETVEPKGKVDHIFQWIVQTNVSYRQIFLPVITHYADANLYDFSSVSVGSVVLSNPPASLVSGKISPIKISKSEDLVVSIRSIDGKSHNLSVRLVTPKELSVEPVSVDLDVLAAGDKAATFRLKNFSALPGSSYAVWAILSEKRNDGVVETAIFGKVSIVRNRILASFRFRRAVMVIIVISVAIYIWLELRTRKSE